MQTHMSQQAAAPTVALQSGPGGQQTGGQGGQAAGGGQVAGGGQAPALNGETRVSFKTCSETDGGPFTGVANNNLIVLPSQSRHGWSG